MAIFIALSGFHNSGKTTLGEYLVNRLSKEGFKVAVIKSTKEKGLITDKEKSDTFRYREAGALVVSLIQRDLLTIYIVNRFKNKIEIINFLEKLFWDYDLILLEGFKEIDEISKIWVLRSEDDPKEIEKVYKNIVLFVKAKDKEKVYNFIKEKFNNNASYIKLYVNSNEIFLKPFIQDLLRNLLFVF